MKVPEAERDGPMGRLRRQFLRALEDFRIPEGGPELQLVFTLGKGRAGPNLDGVRVLFSGEQALAQGLAEVISVILGTERPPEVRRLKTVPAAGQIFLILEHGSGGNPRTAEFLSRREAPGRLAEGEAALLAEYFGWERPEMRYERVKDLDELARPTVEKLLDRSWLLSRGGTGEDRIIDLGEDALRLLMLLDRAGLFDRE